MKEIIDKTKFGILINDNNLNQYEREINNFLINKNNISSDFAKNIILSNYSLDAISKQFEEIYYELNK